MEITLQEPDLMAALANPIVVALMETTSDGCVVIDAETRCIVAMNRRARELLGAEDLDVVGHECKGMLNSTVCTTSCPLTDQMEGVDPSDEEGDLELVYHGSDGDLAIHARTRMILIRAPDGRPLAGIGLPEDVSSERIVEHELDRRRSLHGIIGQSDAMQSVYNLIEQVARTSFRFSSRGSRGRQGTDRGRPAVVFRPSGGPVHQGQLRRVERFAHRERTVRTSAGCVYRCGS